MLVFWEMLLERAIAFLVSLKRALKMFEKPWFKVSTFSALFYTI